MQIFYIITGALNSNYKYLHYIGKECPISILSTVLAHYYYLALLLLSLFSHSLILNTVFTLYLYNLLILNY